MTTYGSGHNAERESPVFVIRQSQVVALRTVVEERFVTDVAEHLNRHYGRLVAGLSSARVAGRIRFGIRRARLHGFDSCNDIRSFVVLLFLVGPTFDEVSEIRASLANVEAADNRIQGLFELPPDVWMMAARARDDAAWREYEDTR